MGLNRSCSKISLVGEKVVKPISTVITAQIIIGNQQGLLAKQYGLEKSKSLIYQSVFSIS